MEDSSNSEPPLCPCGFWGSTKTLGLCSKCYLEYVERSSQTLDGADLDGGQSVGTQVKANQAKAGRSSKMDSNSKHCPSRSSADSLGKQPTCSDDQKDPKAIPTSCATSSATEDRNPSTVLEAGGSRPPSASCSREEMTTPVTESAVLGVKGKEESVPSTSQTVVKKSSELSVTAGSATSCGVVEPCANERLTHVKVPSPHPPSCSPEQSPSKDQVSDLAKQEDHIATPQGTKRSHDEMEKEEVNIQSPVKQKNKKRCLRCSTKLELAQREIGRCRCGGVFCSVHRHPEAHGCDFDHKEDGRREAREKMVKPTRHLGTSFQRLEHS